MVNETDYQKLLQPLDATIKDLQQRKDYSSVTFEVKSAKVTAFAAVEDFTAYKQALLTEQAGGKAVPESQTDDLLTLIAAIINSNLEMEKMGQLNLDRTIEPSTAKDDNQTLGTLQNQVMLFKAGGGQSPPVKGPYWNGGTNWTHPANTVDLSWPPS